MSDYPKVSDEVKSRINSILFVFDFDGTLVPQTKFIDATTNIIQFTGFKLALNPTAFNVKWTIATSRPVQDAALIEECMRRNNSNTTFPIMTQNLQVPQVGNEEEVNFKLQCIEYCVKHYCKNVIYVDNNEELRNKMTEKCPGLICISPVDFLIMTRYRIMECE